MFARRWLSHPPIGVGLAVIALLAIAGLNNHYRDTRGPDRPARQERQQAEVVSQRPAAKSETEKQDERAERDLQAQEQMAKWAFWLFWATIAGVGLLAATLRETWKAGRSAGHILDETRRQADIAADTAARQLRAYLIPGKFTVTRCEAGHKMEVDAFILNCGQTPAYEVRHEAFITPVTEPMEPRDYPQSPSGSRGSLAAGKEMNFTIRTKKALSSDVIQAIKNGHVQVLVHGVARYSDIYGVPHESFFRMHYGIREINRGESVMGVSQEGNRCT